MAELICVHKPVDIGNKPAVLFIHGLDGDIRKTWMADPKDGDTLWPEWIGKDTGCPVWLLGYDAAMSRWKSDSMDIGKQATAVLERLSVEEALGGRPLILIGHSLGGLVIKTAMSHGMFRQVPRHQEVAERVKGIVFVGTPHFGSKLASLAARIGLMRSNPPLEELRFGNANLETLNEYFLKLRNTLNFLTREFAETERVKLGGWVGSLFGTRVVDSLSSNAHIPNETPIPVQADHISICKPRDRQALIHGSLRSFINDIKSLGSAKTQATGEDLILKSADFQAVLPEQQEDSLVDLAFAIFAENLEGRRDSAICTSVCVVTDSPDRLKQQLLKIRFKIQQDPLVSASGKQLASTAQLHEMALDPATQSAFLRELAVISFSAYLYYGTKIGLERLSIDERIDQLVIQPLVHRLSKKSERFRQVHSGSANMTAHLSAAAQQISEKFHRRVEIPQSGSGRYEVLEELASLIAWVSAEHLESPATSRSSVIFESLRTRIRFGQDVISGQIHKRDVNPLP